MNAAKMFYRFNRSLEWARHRARNIILGFFGRRILIARFDAYNHVWLNGVEITDCWRARVSKESGKDWVGWLDIYQRNEKKQLSLDVHGRIKSKREFGIVRWMPKHA